VLDIKSYYQIFRPKSNIINKTCRAKRYHWLRSLECDFCTFVECCS